MSEFLRSWTPRRILRECVKAGPLWPLIHPRRFHAYCVGPPKSGTVSVWGLFSERCRAAHEAGRPVVVELINRKIQGSHEPRTLMKRLRNRDRDLRLEMDSFSLLAAFSGELVSAFPQSRFILTVRSPQKWLNSIMNQHLNVDVSNRPADRLARQLLYNPPGSAYSKGEGVLEDRGLFPIDGYLEGWCTHYSWVLDSVPEERLLVIRTEDLRSSVDRIASFLGISTDLVDADRSHLHRASHDHGILALLPSGLLEEKIDSRCRELLVWLDALESRGKNTGTPVDTDGSWRN